MAGEYQFSLIDVTKQQGTKTILKGTGAKVTRLAFGLPADSGIAYSDPLTLKRAIYGRMGV